MRFLLLSIFIASISMGADFVLKPMTAQELQAESVGRGAEPKTFKTKTFSPNTVFFTGLIKPVQRSEEPPDILFLKADVKIPKSVLLSDHIKLSPIRNQGSCGSCVYFASSATFEDTFLFRVGLPIVSTAPQFLMDCVAPQSACSGSYFEYVSAGMVSKGVVKESDYPYRAQTEGCRAKPSQLAKPEDRRIIDGSPKSIMTALKSGYAVANTIFAGGSLMNYSEGVFNACSNVGDVGTNHEISIVGANCESAVDADGNCKFDENGNLPDGVGYYVERNSWGTNWGDDGFFKIKMTDRNGNKCNNVAEEAGIFVMGKDPAPPVPPVPPVPPGPSVPPYVYLIIAVLSIGLIISLILKRK